MNLLYSLHFYGFAACPIIWGMEPDNDKRLYHLLSIPDSDTVVALIVAGNYPIGTYRYAKSLRKSTDKILHIVK